MPVVTFQVIEGIDKGRIFRDLPTPVTLGREEGNLLRLNDERVSRFHAKIQVDNGEFIITDLESTNGTRVNGNVVQIRRLRAGDRVGIGRSTLLFGSDEQIAARSAALSQASASGTAAGAQVSATVFGNPGDIDNDADFDLNPGEEITTSNGTVYMGTKALPPLPQKMTPSQAARLAEMFDFLHRNLTAATENTQANEEAVQITLNYADWQRILAVEMVLARYVRAVAEPDALDD